MLAKYLLIPGLIYFSWRLWYFREWLPLPFLVKSSGVRDLGNTFASIVTIVLPAVVVILCSPRRVTLCVRLLTLFLVPILFYSSLRLEQNIGNRFLAPLFFGSLWQLGLEVEISGCLAFILLSAYLSWPWTSETFLYLFETKNDNTYLVSRQISMLKPGTILTTEAGNVAFYSDWPTEDSWGLNTPRFAHRLISEADVLAGSYDIIIAHCNIEWLSPTNRPADHPSRIRSWDNHCRALTNFIRSSRYDAFVLPMSRSSPTSPDSTGGQVGIPLICSMQVIYAVSDKYPQRSQLEQILLANGGIRFSYRDRSYVGDSRCNRPIG